MGGSKKNKQSKVTQLRPQAEQEIIKPVVIAQNEHGVIEKNDASYNALVTFNLTTCVAMVVHTRTHKHFLAHIDIATSESSILSMLAECRREGIVGNIQVVLNDGYVSAKKISNSEKVSRSDNFTSVVALLKRVKLPYKAEKVQSDSAVLFKDGTLSFGMSERLDESSEVVIRREGRDIVVDNNDLASAIANLNAVCVMNRNSGEQVRDLFARYAGGNLEVGNEAIVYNGIALLESCREFGFYTSESIAQALVSRFGHDFGGSVNLLADSVAKILASEEQSLKVSSEIIDASVLHGETVVSDDKDGSQKSFVEIASASSGAAAEEIDEGFVLV